MASELVLQYSVGRHWTGSMIELGNDRNGEIESSSNYFEYGGHGRDIFSRRMIGKYGINGLLNGGYSQEVVLENILAASTKNSLSKMHRCLKKSNLNGDSNDIFQYSLTQCILPIIKDKLQTRHSFTSLMSAEDLNRQTRTHLPSRRARNRQPRCRSSEPETSRREESVSPCRHKHPFLTNSQSQLPDIQDMPTSISPLYFETNIQLQLNVQNKLSLSDSAIFYNHKVEMTVFDKTVETLKDEAESVGNAQDELRNEKQQEEEEKDNELGKTNLNFADESELLTVAGETADFMLKQAEPIMNTTNENVSNEQEQEQLNSAKIEVHAPVKFEEPGDDEPLPLAMSQGDSDSFDSSSSSNISPTLNDEELKKPEVKRKKSVRFADDEGRQLTIERLIMDSALPPLLSRRRLDSLDDDFRDLGDHLRFPDLYANPTSSLIRHKIPSLPDIKLPTLVSKLPISYSSTSLTNISDNYSPPDTPPPFNWRLTFTQPAAQYQAFRQRLEANYASLENISVSSLASKSQTVILYGTIKVKNITFEKHVKLRVTLDKWATFKDYVATHSEKMSVVSGANNPYDVFTFNISISFEENANAMQELQFAVLFQAGKDGADGEYWDNNDGFNYVIVREPTQCSTIRIGGTARCAPSLQFFRPHSPREVGVPGCLTVGSAGEHMASISSPPCSNTPYTIDYRPKFDGFQSLTCYSSWQHYSNESMYY